MKNINFHHGITLMEMVILIIVALALGISAFTLWPTTFLIVLQAEATRIASDIRYVQNLAKTKGGNYRFNYVAVPAGNSYYNFQVSSGGSWVNIYYDSLATTSNDIMVGTGISFLASGTIDFNGTAEPNADATITIQKGSDQKSIIVKKTTRRIYVE